MKAALGIMTTDTQPKMAMENCKIGNSSVKIYELQRLRMIKPTWPIHWPIFLLMQIYLMKF